ncbi:MAG: hypothetical protein EXS55_00415 [Candidatus Magasanikbacteria bacterium]|nr:hypothetical protein [Candidatus Magasanikbacteria bacterium]
MIKYDSLAAVEALRERERSARVERAKKLFGDRLKEKFGDRFSDQLNPAIPSNELPGLTQDDLTVGTLSDISALISDLEDGGVRSFGVGEEDRIVLLIDTKLTIEHIKGARVAWDDRNQEQSTIAIPEMDSAYGTEIDLVPNAHHSGLIAQINEAKGRYEFFVRFGAIHFGDGRAINSPNKFAQLTLHTIIEAGLPLAVPDREFYLQYYNSPKEIKGNLK